MLAKKTTKKPVTTIYIGRSLVGLPANTIFKGGALPPHVAEMAQKNPHIAALIVPVGDLQESRKNIAKKGHILNFHAKHLNDKEH